MSPFRGAVRVLDTLFIFGMLSACTTPGYQPAFKEPPTPTPTPPGPPPEPPKPDFIRCRVSNGAGRVFQVTHEDAYLAESNARRECLRTARSCVLLGCHPTKEKPQ
jgi:hypothetical protein